MWNTEGKARRGRALLLLLHGMRAVKRTFLLRVNQQLAGPREERHRGREGGLSWLGDAACQTANVPGLCLLSFHHGINMMERRDGEQQETLEQSDDKFSKHTQKHRIVSYFPLQLPLSYIQRAGPADA